MKKLNELNAVERFPMNDRGSADLFATIFKNVSRYNPTKKDWMYYDKTRWTADTEGMRAKRNAKMLADVLVRYSVTASLPDDKRQSYIKYAAGMMNYRNRNVMITDAKDLNFFENTELDKDDFLINCRNCVLDLSEDQPKVLEHNADLLLSKICSEDSDKIGKFISECLEKSDENLAAKDVYEKYSQWCNDCGLGVDGRTSFYEELKTKNLLSKTGTVTGKTVKNVIKGYSFAEETFHSVDRGLDAPFS